MIWFKWILKVIFDFLRTLKEVRARKRQEKLKKQKQLEKRIKKWEEKLKNDIEKIEEPTFDKNDPMGTKYWNRD